MKCEKTKVVGELKKFKKIKVQEEEDKIMLTLRIRFGYIGLFLLIFSAKFKGKVNIEITRRKTEKKPFPQHQQK